MDDAERDKRIMFLLKFWFHLTERGLVWPSVKLWVEQKINEEFPDSKEESGK